MFNFGRGHLSETWAALWALETLGQLNLIDHEACTQGILRFYQGKGVFKADSTPRIPIITGNEDDAFYAMESLARLNALDRIKDFQTWRFKSVTQNVTVGNSTSPGHVTATALLVWAYQERLDKYQKSVRKDGQ